MDIHTSPTPACQFDGEDIDVYGTESYWHCTNDASTECCGIALCADCIDAHRDAAHGCWCSGTGMILFDGVLVPCTVCG